MYYYLIHVTRSIFVFSRGHIEPVSVMDWGRRRLGKREREMDVCVACGQTNCDYASPVYLLPLCCRDCVEVYELRTFGATRQKQHHAGDGSDDRVTHFILKQVELLLLWLAKGGPDDPIGTETFLRKEEAFLRKHTPKLARAQRKAFVKALKGLMGHHHKKQQQQQHDKESLRTRVHSLVDEFSLRQYIVADKNRDDENYSK